MYRVLGDAVVAAATAKGHLAVAFAPVVVAVAALVVIVVVVQVHPAVAAGEAARPADPQVPVQAQDDVDLARQRHKVRRAPLDQGRRHRQERPVLELQNGRSGATKRV